MPRVYFPNTMLSGKTRRRFSRPCEFGFGMYGFMKYAAEFVGISWRPLGRCRFGDVEFGDYTLLSGIYAKRNYAGENSVVRMKFYQPTYSNSVPIQASRTKFAEAITGWQSLTAEQKQVYNERVKNRLLSGYNLFIREYMYG